MEVDSLEAPPMPPERFLDALNHLGMSQVEAARYFRRSIKQVNRYATGKSPVPWETEMVLTMMVALGIKPGEIGWVHKTYLRLHAMYGRASG